MKDPYSELNDEGQWITHYHDQESELSRRGVLYMELAKPKTPDKPMKVREYDPQNYLPYRGFDHKRFPRTFLTLLMFYHMPGWWSEGKIVPGAYPKIYAKTNQEDNQEEEDNGTTP